MHPKIKSSFWTDDGVGDLSPQHKLAYLWLITNDRTNNIGFCEVSKRQFKTDTGLPFTELEGVLKAHTRGFVWNEENGQLRVWIRTFIKHQWSDGELKPTSRLFPHLQKLAEALPDYFKKPLASSYPALCKPLEDGKPLARGQSSTEQHSTEHPIGGAGGASAEIPSEAEVLSEAKAFPGDLTRAIPAGMPEAWVLSWIAWRMSEKAGAFPVDWKADLRRRFIADWVEGRKNTRHPVAKKTAPTKTADIDAQVEIGSLRAELEWQDNPSRRLEIKKRLAELGGAE